MDFWKKFDQEWAELNKRSPTPHTNPSPDGNPHTNHPSPDGKPIKNLGGAQAARTAKTVLRSSSTNKTHDVSRPPCRLVWMPGLLPRSFQPVGLHERTCS